MNFGANGWLIVWDYYYTGALKALLVAYYARGFINAFVPLPPAANIFGFCTEDELTAACEKALLGGAEALTNGLSATIVLPLMNGLGLASGGGDSFFGCSAGLSEVNFGCKLD